MIKKMNTKNISTTFAKGLQVFSAFDGVERELTIPEVARKTDLDRTVTRRLVLTLEAMGYLESRGGRSYQLTPKVLGLASYFLRGRGIGKHVDPILRSFSQRLGEGISFAVLNDLEAIYVAHSPSDPTMITQGFTVGFRLPLTATAIGRALMAFSADDVREHLVKHAPRQPFTSVTRVRLEELEGALLQVKALGYSLVANEFEPGVTSLAVPILCPGRGLVGALGIAGPTPRFEQTSNLEHRVRILYECAEAVAFIA